MSKLDFLVVGAQKCATSWLYYCLRDHFQICVPPDKNDEVYLGNPKCPNDIGKYLSKYIGRCNEPSKVGDVSVDYMMDKNCIRVLGKDTDETKVISVLRDPVNRAISSYYWNVRRGNVQNIDIEVGLSQCLDIARSNCYNGEFNQDEYQINILQRGLYAPQLKKFVELVGRKNMLIIPFRIIKNDSREAIRRVYNFLGVSDQFTPSQLTRTRRPKRNAYIPALLRLERDLPEMWICNRLIDFLNQTVSYVGLGNERPELSESLLLDLRSYYASSVLRLLNMVEEVPSSSGLWKNVEWPEKYY